jgi:hypothetical protein
LGSAGAGPVEIGGCFEQAEPSPRRSDRIKRLFIRRLPNCEAKRSHEEQAARRGPRPLSQSWSPNLSKLPPRDGRADAGAGSAGNVQRVFGLLIRSKSGELSDETQSEFGLCSVAVLVVLPRPTQRAFGSEALGEKKVTICRPYWHQGRRIRLKLALRSTGGPATSVTGRALSQPVPFVCSTPINSSPAVARGFFFVAVRSAIRQARLSW